MHSGMRRFLAGILALAIILLAFYPCWWLHLLIMRELYALSDAMGLLTGSPVRAMQIMGRYITRPPEWLRWTVEILAAMGGFGPALVGALAAHQAVAFRAHLRPRIASGRWVARVLTMSIVVAAGIAVLSTWIEWPMREWILDLGRSAGCSVAMISGRLLMTDDGPFIDGRCHGAFNLMYGWLPLVLPVIAAFVPALLMQHLLLRRAGRTQTQCLSCGYELRGNTSGVCPECGVMLSSAPDAGRARH